jgi:hypothetical protein
MVHPICKLKNKNKLFSREKKKFWWAVNFWPKISSLLGKKDGTFFGPKF